MPTDNIPTEKYIRDELEYIHATLMNTPGAFLIEKVVDVAKDYCTDDVHRWGQEKGNYGVYGKIRDLVKVRIFEAVAAEKLDRTLASEILKTYYYSTVKDGDGGVVGKREIVVRFV